MGFLYGKRDLLEALPPAKFGGSMVELAFVDRPAQYMAPPARFEAGTQPVAQVVAAGVAAEWMMGIGIETIAGHERIITEELLRLAEVDGVRILGPRTERTASARWPLKWMGCIRTMWGSTSTPKVSRYV